MAVLDQLKKANPDGRFWLKLEAADLNEALMESVSGVWNGDVDLGNGKLQELQRVYDSRVSLVSRLTVVQTWQGLEVELGKCVDSLADDIPFLDEGFKLAVEDYRKNFDNRSTPEEKLKSVNWNIVEFQTLLQQAQQLKGAYEEQLTNLNPAVRHDVEPSGPLLEGWFQASNPIFETSSKRRDIDILIS